MAYKLDQSSINYTSQPTSQAVSHTVVMISASRKHGEGLSRPLTLPCLGNISA